MYIQLYVMYSNLRNGSNTNTHTTQMHTHLLILGSYEKTGWTDQLSRPKKKPRTRFQTLPTSPGGPIIGLNFIIKIISVKCHTLADHTADKSNIFLDDKTRKIIKILVIVILINTFHYVFKYNAFVAFFVFF